MAIEITALQGCADVENGLAIDTGRSSFRLVVTGEEAAKASELSFTVTPSSRYRGSIGRMIVRANEVLVSETQLPAYQTTNASIRLRSVKAAQAFTIETTFESESEPSGGIADFDFVAAHLTNFSIRPLDDELQSRAHLISCAKMISKDLGLHKNYLTIEKARRLTARAISAINDKQGFSFIRLGDGEGRLLGYPHYFTDHEVLSQVLQYHFGPRSMGWMRTTRREEWVSASMQHLHNLLVASLRNADVVGLPVLDFFKGDRDRYGHLAYACALVFSLPLLSRAARECVVGTNVFYTAIPQDILLGEILEASSRIHIVGPWDLRHELGDALVRTDIGFIEVPGHYTWSAEKAFGQFPHQYRLVEAQLRNKGDLSGQTFLVGAGPLGKHYCNIIKLYGGVALDIGVVFDVWARKGRPAALKNDKATLEKLKAFRLRRIQGQTS